MSNPKEQLKFEFKQRGQNLIITLSDGTVLTKVIKEKSERDAMVATIKTYIEGKSSKAAFNSIVKAMSPVAEAVKEEKVKEKAATKAMKKVTKDVDKAVKKANAKSESPTSMSIKDLLDKEELTADEKDLLEKASKKHLASKPVKEVPVQKPVRRGGEY